MITTFYASVWRWLLRFITFQLFISLMSLPLLIAWGLPLSILSPFGNGLFNPLLTLFLMLSTLIFVTELIYLPNQWLCWLLEKTNTLFVATSSYADSSWLVGIRQLPLLILFAIPLVGLWIIITPQLRTQGFRALALAGALIVIFISAYFTNSSYLGECTYGGKNKSTIIAYADHTLAVFDYGALNTTFRYRTWWDYTLMSEITKNTGNTTIDYLVCLQPSEKTLEGIAMITGITPIRHIVIVLTTTKRNFLHEDLDSLITSLATKKISCTVQILEKPEQPTSLIDTTSGTSDALTACMPSPWESSSWEPNKDTSETFRLTKKISYCLHTNPRSRASRSMSATITCDNETLTIGMPTNSKTLLIGSNDLDKQPHAL